MRVKVENTIGLLKVRMRSLLYSLRCHSTTMCVQTIIASGVLHNICLADLDEVEDFLCDTLPHESTFFNRDGLIDLPPTAEQAEDEEMLTENSDSHSEDQRQTGCVRGNRLRDALCSSLALSRINPSIIEDHPYTVYHSFI